MIITVSISYLVILQKAILYNYIIKTSKSNRCRQPLHCNLNFYHMWGCGETNWTVITSLNSKWVTAEFPSLALSRMQLFLIIPIFPFTWTAWLATINHEKKKVLALYAFSMHYRFRTPYPNTSRGLLLELHTLKISTSLCLLIFRLHLALENTTVILELWLRVFNENNRTILFLNVAFQEKNSCKLHSNSWNTE